MRVAGDGVLVLRCLRLVLEPVGFWYMGNWP